MPELTPHGTKLTVVDGSQDPALKQPGAPKPTSDNIRVEFAKLLGRLFADQWRQEHNQEEFGADIVPK